MDVNIVNVQETVKSQQTVTQVHQIRTRHYEHYYQQHAQHYHSRSSLNHSYDPNMCTTAARFTDAFYTNKNTTDSVSATELQAVPPSTDAQDEDLLCYNNVVLLHETAEIGAEAIVGNTELLDESPLPMASLQTQIHVQEETFVSNYQFMQCTQPVDTNSNTQLAGMVIQRSPNGHLYQNFMLNADDTTKEADEAVHIQTHQHNHYHHHCDVNMYDAHQAAVVDVEEETATHLNNFEIPTQFTFQHEPQVSAADENSVELMAKFAADLANLSTVVEHFEPINRHLAIASKDHQRMLLESTMSPLLAAVNDITKRDAELKTYFNENVEKESELSTTEYLQDENNYYSNRQGSVQTKQQNAENFEDSSGEDDYLLVSDKPVESRSKASLPTNYLYFGNIDSNTQAPSVYAKKSIPHRTKFGPFEGEIQYISDIDLDVLQVQTPRYYPMLMIDDCHMLDVENEDSSNWMRYIRLAQTYRQQNLQILLEDGKIYFKCSRLIRPKEELRVGYHNSYAARFFLPSLEPTVEDLKAEFSRMHPWKCFECEECCATLGEFRLHLKSHDDNEGELESSCTKQKLVKKRRRKVRLKNKQLKQNTLNYSKKHLSKNAICCKLCRKVFMTNETLKQHVAKHHNTHGIKRKSTKAIKDSNKIVKQKEPKYMYKCNLCAKRFHNEIRLQQHKLTHRDNIAKPHVCSECQQQCATPAALAAHVRSHANTQYECVFCQQKFKYVRDFKKHVEMHKSANHTYQCMHCNKDYNGYHLLRKHMHMFHITKAYNCDNCNKKFQNYNTLQRHMLLHSQIKSHACEICNRRFNRKDHLNTHLKRMHSLNNSAKKSKETEKKLRTKTKGYEENEQVTTSSVPELLMSTPEDNDTKIKNDQIKLTMTTNLKTESIVPVKSSLLPPELPLEETMNLNSKKPAATTTSTSSSNRRKQTPTKLKALELNTETLTYVALSEMLSPFIITEQDLNAEFKKPANDAVATIEKQNSPIDSTKQIELNDQTHINSNLHAEVTTKEKQASFNTEDENPNTSAELNGITGTAIPSYPFICHICPHTFFKRRGMLVNHFAKIHPTVNVNEIKLLSTPIVRQQLMFPCPYCSKIYKLNAKRKVHILKHHPDQELPTSIRRQQHNTTLTAAAILTETSIPVGTLTVSVHKCNLCYKQYAARNRLVSHYRKSHPKEAIPSLQQQRFQRTPPTLIHEDEHTTTGVENYHHELLEPEIDIIPYHLQPPVSPENKLLKLSSAALELSRFDFLNERDRCSNDHLVSNVFADHTTHGELNRLPQLFEEASIADIDTTSMEKYNRSIEAQFFEKISKFS